MSDLSPECAPKRTSADRSEFMGSRPSTTVRRGRFCSAIRQSETGSTNELTPGNAGVNFLENQNETATTALVAKRLRIQLKVAPRSQLRSGEFNQSAQLTQITCVF
jgi:hypothetical protein